MVYTAYCFYKSYILEFLMRLNHRGREVVLQSVSFFLFTMLLSMSFLGGCNFMIGSSPESSSRKPDILTIDSGDAINSINLDSYSFSGSCLENGENNIDFSVASSSSTESITGKMDCEEGKWRLVLSEDNLLSLSDGEITLSLTLSNFSSDLVVIKDIVIPVISSVTGTQGLLEWRCDSTDTCPENYQYRGVINSHSTHTFLNNEAFSSVTHDSLLETMSSNGDEDLYLHMQARDVAGNISSSVTSSQSFRYDNAAPLVTGVSATSSNSNTAFGKQGDIISFQVSFDDNFTVTGTPAINLGSQRTADCTNCNTVGQLAPLTFSYTVAGTDDGTLQVAGFVFDSNESITDAVGNQVGTTLSSPVAVSGVTLDTTSPTVQSFVVNGNSWGWGCSEASCQYRSFVNDSQSTPASLSSSYGAAATADLPASTPSAIPYVHVQARDAAGNESVIATTADAPSISGITTGPAAKAYTAGKNINFQVSFNRMVQVDTSDGTPRLPLRIGNQNRFATYSSGSGSPTLSFRYTVVSGDSDTNGIALGSSGAIDFNGGRVNNLTSAPLTFSAQTFTTVLVDGVAPYVVGLHGLSRNPDVNLGKTGDTIILYVSFNEDVISFPDLKINSSSGHSGGCTNCGFRPWQRSLIFSYTVAKTDGVRFKMTGFSSTGVIDRAGNRVGKTLSSPMALDTLTLDTTNPTVQNIAVHNDSWRWGCSEASCRYRFLINDSQSPPARLSSSYGRAATSSPPVTFGTYYVHVQARDVAGNESAIATSADSIVVIATPPEIVSITGPVAGTYSIGQDLDFQVIFDRTVQVVSGTPRLPLAMGSQNRLATYSSGSDSHTLSFRYTVVSGDSDMNGIALGSSGVIDLSGVVINDFTNPSISFAPQDFTTVLVDGANSAAVTIANSPSSEINSANAAAYSVSGNCEGEYEVRVRVGNIAPSSAPHCNGSGTWTTTLHVGNLDKGSVTITASQTNSDTSVTKQATPVSVTVGDFEQVARVSSRMAGGASPGNTTLENSGHTCVVKSDGRVSCWGGNARGQLGNNSTSHSNYPVDVRGHSGAANSFLENIVGVTLGRSHSCALNSQGEVLCWGLGSNGQIGNDSRDDRHYPRFVHGINNSGRLRGIVQVSAGYNHSCALGSNGQVSCWGHSVTFQSTGIPAYSSAQVYPSLIRVSENGAALDSIVQIAVGVNHSCALNSRGKVLCWGVSREGQLGNGTSGGSFNDPPLLYPVAVRESTGAQGSTLDDVVQISIGGSSSCALKSDGTVHCWGKGYTGTRSVISSLYPSAISVTNVSALTQSTSYADHSHLDTKCVLDISGTAKCWGNNNRGQLTDSDSSNKNITTIRATSNSQRSLRGIVEIRPTVFSTCALMATGKVKCWGLNILIGVGGIGRTYFPVHVPTSSSGPDFTPGAGSSQYICRKNFSKCILSPVSLAPGGGESNPIISGASSAIDIYGLEDGATLTLFSDSSCSSEFVGGSVTGVTASNPQAVTLANQVTDRELFLSYKIGGNDEVNSSLCLKSQIIFDRVAPAAPTTIFFGESEPAEDATNEQISRLPSSVKVKVLGNGADSIKDYTVRVYFEDSTCGNEDNLVAEGHYDNSATLTLTMTTPPYQWNAYDPLDATQAFTFYARSLDLAGNSSDCVASLPLDLPVPVPNFME